MKLIIKILNYIIDFLKGSNDGRTDVHPECPDCSNNVHYEVIDCWCIPLYERDKWRQIADDFALIHRKYYGLDGAWDKELRAYDRAVRGE